MNRIVQECFDGCGAKRVLKYPDGFKVDPWDSHTEAAALAQANAEAKDAVEDELAQKVNAIIDVRLRFHGLIQ